MSRTKHIHVDVERQTLSCISNDEVVRTFPVSTAARGTGQQAGSLQTPLGRHRIRARIGAGQPPGAVFVGRRPTGELWTPELHSAYPERDWVLTRILWLCGMEPGHNRLGTVDSMQRYIYIHGTPDVHPIGQPASHGCVRMSNDDVIWLFDWAPAGTELVIAEAALS